MQRVRAIPVRGAVSIDRRRFGVVTRPQRPRRLATLAAAAVVLTVAGNARAAMITATSLSPREEACSAVSPFLTAAGTGVTDATIDRHDSGPSDPGRTPVISGRCARTLFAP